MNTAETGLGPIDYLIVEWPADSPPTGQAFPYLIDLVDRGLIRILDFVFVQKDHDGRTFAAGIADFDLDGQPDLAVLTDASSGLLNEEDYDEAGSVIEPGCAAAILIYENAWAQPFATALRSSGARLVGYGHVPMDELVATLDELEAADA